MWCDGERERCDHLRARELTFKRDFATRALRGHLRSSPQPNRLRELKRAAVEKGSAHILEE